MATKRLSDGSSIKNSFKLSRGATSAAKPEAPTIGAATSTGVTTATVAYTAATLGAAANKQYLAYDVTVGATDTTTLTLGLTLASGDVLKIYASTATLAFNAFGSQIS